MLLIVDDTPENLAVIKDMLAPFGFEIIEAKDGYDAIEQMLEQKPDLIFKYLDNYLTHRKVSSDYLFNNSYGKKLSPRSMHNRIIKILIKSSCPTTGLTPHSFRKAVFQSRSSSALAYLIMASSKD